MADDEEKTEEPTPKKRQESRDKGEVSKSQEFNSVVILIVGLSSLYANRYDLYHSLANLMVIVFQEIPNVEVSVASVSHYAQIGTLYLAKMLAPIVLPILVAGIVVNVVQVGFLLSLKAIEPKFSKINPIKGIKNLVSMQKLFELVKNLLKIGIIATISYQIISKELPMILGLSSCSVGQIFEVLFGLMFKLGIRIALVLIVLAIIDFLYQRHTHEQKLKMSKHEIKEERKGSEGSDEVKARIKALQREMAQRRMMDDVPEATVVITNPTFIAIALKYKMGVDSAPSVLAKGKRKTAERIKEIARENDIPIVEDKPLARGMYDLIDIGGDIPQEYFTPIAEILAYVYRLKNKAA